MLVIRMEHPIDRMGVYTSDRSPEHIKEEMMELSGAHPLPMDDSLLTQSITKRKVLNEEYLYGFKDWQQFRAWFYKDEWINGFLEAGFEIRVFNIPEVHVGYTQCVWECELRTEPLVVFGYEYLIPEIEEEIKSLYSNPQFN